MYQPWPARNYPPVWRVALAFILAPGAAALLVAIAMPAYEGLPNWSERVWRTAVTFGLIVAYPTAVMFGLPAYLALRQHFATGPLACSFVGFVIAALPWSLLALASSSASDASIIVRTTVINNAKFLLAIGVFGAIAGFVFWAVATVPLSFRQPTE